MIGQIDFDVWSAIALLVAAWLHPLVAVATILVVTIRMAMLEITEGRIRKRLLVRVAS